MAELESDRARLLRDCQTNVGRLLAVRGWQLLDSDEWAQQAFELARSGQIADPRRAAIYAYSLALHRACSGAEGPQRQNRGYEELFQYLYDGARRRYSRIAEDMTQRAIELVFTRFGRCHTPSAFLAFAFQQLLDTARMMRRQEELNVSLGTPTDSHSHMRESDQGQADLAAGVIAEELRERFEALSVEFLRKHPRAQQQFTALRLKYIDGLDEATISRRLGKSIGSVYTLRARAIEKLRAEPAWRALAAEFGILPDEETRG